MASVICSACFKDHGLRLEAERLGTDDMSACPNCGSAAGWKLDANLAVHLAENFFVWGTLTRSRYGAAPRVVFNPAQSTTITPAPWLEEDLRLLERTLGMGFFHYGPRLWMVGEIEPLKELEEPSTRAITVERIIASYPRTILRKGESFHRIRSNPKNPAETSEYDSPPAPLAGNHRLDSPNQPVMYGSKDLDVCVHECRVTAEDDVYVATLEPSDELTLLDLSQVLEEPDVTEFESLDLAVHMLFLAGAHSYEISRHIARAARSQGYDGVFYPSYFSLLRTGGMPFETTLGMSHRRIPELRDRERAKIVPNIALFGRPLQEEKVQIRCIDRVVLTWVEYGLRFGPIVQ